mmetsp:Transcript_27283/g.58384  ORF Transcript_27283/g.58384 Transcript_27283/m.58384 type:complete len:134 (-) Transcript_27283:328-729(-)|eukprot:CAMPEP_0201120438 /NCGR_PEP_ID=MMETSP0850-20130426/4500_1 /ASSEMBLY_ACC=CAM_ASM_000622 /TAXON_ID=183588 /ORGANISM="Pseudo-nitzschia fraudulenta, Strain WWA7" /LENGTH=133 /DNA_ID=CAMNT_0047386571 /DNA_START=19 /DNA_END=420 /DNA_ORIENTATION=-
MGRFAFSSMACAAVVALISLGSSSALAPMTSSVSSPVETKSEAFVTRRSAAIAVIGSALAVPGLAFAANDQTEAEKAAAEAARERMRQRIAESKKNYRKGSDLVKQRKETTDYSCVAETGSPCPEKPTTTNSE